MRNLELSNGGPNPDLLYVPNFALHRLISLRLIALSSGDHKFQAFLWQFDPEKDFWIVLMVCETLKGGTSYLTTSYRIDWKGSKKLS